MGRAPRVDFPLAIHHVTNRGVRGTNIFTSDSDRKIFLEILTQYCREYGITVFSYALMPNHFHLVLQSLEGRLSSFMNTFESSYAEWFNREQAEDDKGGTLFNHPYASELVQEGSYLLMAVRYVLTNPHRSGFAEETEIFHPWTSMSEWQAEDANSIVTDFGSLFSHLENVNPKNFVEYVMDDPHLTSNKMNDLSRRVRDIKVLGDDDFLESILAKNEKSIRSRESKGPVPPEKILNSVVEFTSFSSREELISSSRDHKHSSERYATFYLLRVRSHLSLGEIGEIFGISGAAVSKGIGKFRKRDWDPIIELLDYWGIEQPS